MTDGRLALLNSGTFDYSNDLRIVQGADFTYFEVQTTGDYHLSYTVTWRATNAEPDIRQLSTFLTSSTPCNLANMASNTNTLNFAHADLSLIIDEQKFYPIYGASVRRLTAGTCVALKAWEVTPASGNEAEMVRSQLIIERVK